MKLNIPGWIASVWVCTGAVEAVLKIRDGRCRWSLLRPRASLGIASRTDSESAMALTIEKNDGSYQYWSLGQ